jgi:hypothetical protein
MKSWSDFRESRCFSYVLGLIKARAGFDERKPTEHTFTDGWPSVHLFKNLRFRKCDVLNRGFSGYNTRWAKIILPRLIRMGSSLDSPVAVTIFFGANDSALKGKGIFVFFQLIFTIFMLHCA